MMMGGYGMGFGLWWLIIAVVIVIPFWRLLPRFGMPNWLSLVSIIPLGALVLLYVMAFRDSDGGDGQA